MNVNVNIIDQRPKIKKNIFIIYAKKRTELRQKWTSYVVELKPVYFVIFKESFSITPFQYFRISSRWALLSNFS